MDPINSALIAALVGLIGVVWRNLNWRLKQHEERMSAMDQTALYLRDQVHSIKNMLPNPAENEARRMENRDNFNRLFSMMREVEQRLNEITGELRARSHDGR